MITTHKVSMDLVDSIGKYVLPIDVMQADYYSRDIEFTLTSGGQTPDFTGNTALICFEKSDGTGGNYDKMPDGTIAYRITKNVVKVSLAPQVLTAAGKVYLAVAIIAGNVKLHTFSVTLNVHKNPGLNPISTSYVSIAGTVPSDGWDAGVFLGTDAQGKVVARRDVLTTDRDQILDDRTQEDVRKNIGAASSDDIVRLEGKLPKEKQYEPIAEIFVSEKETTATRVVFTIDENGSAFSLTDFFIRANAGFVDGTKSTLYMYVNGKAVVINGSVPSVNNTLDRGFSIYFRQEPDGFWRVEYTNSMMGTNLFNPQAVIANSRLIPPVENLVGSLVTNIEIYLSGGDTNGFVAGSTFELWGVRA